MRSTNWAIASRNCSSGEEAQTIRAQIGREKEENLCSYSIHQIKSNAPKPLARIRFVVGSKVVGMKRSAIKLLIKPTKDADFSGAERFEPAVD